MILQWRGNGNVKIQNVSQTHHISVIREMHNRYFLARIIKSKELWKLPGYIKWEHTMSLSKAVCQLMRYASFAAVTALLKWVPPPLLCRWLDPISLSQSHEDLTFLLSIEIIENSTEKMSVMLNYVDMYNHVSLFWFLLVLTLTCECNKSHLISWGVFKFL